MSTGAQCAYSFHRCGYAHYPEDSAAAADIRILADQRMYAEKERNHQKSGGGNRSARPRGLGGDFEFLPLKSPRNPITPIETSRVATLHPGLYKIFEIARNVDGRAMRLLLPPLRRSPSLDEGGLGVSPVKAFGLAVDCI